ncbi:MAG TPA: TetR/AcrR family transcriptional regulator [Candidatus Limnocylindrales bacterium]
MARPSRRDVLLDAAERIVRDKGANHLTFDAVAAEANTSKGGLLYHFASKDELVAAMVERLVASFDGSLNAHAAADKSATGRWTRAYVATTAAPDGRSADDMTASALLAAVACNPGLIEPLRDRYRVWREAAAADGIAPEDALIAMLAADGLWIADLLGFAPPTGELRARLIERMGQLARGAG